ncbi:hypothetical protein LFM09_36555 [Lentzea alba]|uniref:hypothetical protein n=1 Tax=Lentzea alba TaxID=2714351 RepID=UPI0039BF807A
MGNRNAWLSTFFLFGGFLLIGVLADKFGDRLGLPFPFYVTGVGLVLLALAGLLRPIYKDVPIDPKLGNPFYVALFYAGGGAWFWMATGLMSIGVTGWLAFPGVIFLAGVALLAIGSVWRLETLAVIGLGLVLVFSLVCMIVGAVLVFPLGWGWFVLYLIGAVIALLALSGVTVWSQGRMVPQAARPATSSAGPAARRLPDGRVVVGRRVVRQRPEADGRR